MIHSASPHPPQPNHGASATHRHWLALTSLLLAVSLLHWAALGSLPGPTGQEVAEAPTQPVWRVQTLAPPDRQAVDTAAVDTATPLAAGSPSTAAAPAPTPAPLPIAQTPQQQEQQPSQVSAPRDEALPQQAALGEAAPPATRLPPSATRLYTARQGTRQQTLQLRWSQDGERYELSLDAAGWWVQRSEGMFDAWGLAPQRHTDQREGRSTRALSLVRPGADSPAWLGLSARSQTWPLPAGAQDGASWLPQLLAQIGAMPRASWSGHHWSLPVATVAAGLQVWEFRPEADAADRSDEPATLRGLFKLVREPQHAYDSRLELWLEDAPPHWPAQLRWRGASGRELTLTHAAPTPQD